MYVNRRHMLSLAAAGATLPLFARLAWAEDTEAPMLDGRKIITKRYKYFEDAGELAPAIGGTWVEAAGCPAMVQEIYPTLHEGEIWVAGGFAGAEKRLSITDRVFVYSPKANSWREGPKLPANRHHISLASAGGKLYAIGGHHFADSKWWRMQASVWVLDGGEWREGPTLPQPQAEMVTLVDGDHIHIMGGRRLISDGENEKRNHHEDVAAHLILDTASGTWTEAAPVPVARNSAAGDIIDGKFHIVGGRQGTKNLTFHGVYDPKTDKWETRAPVPQGQAGWAAAAVGRKLYAFGGEIFKQRSRVFHEGWMYDADQDKWFRLPDMPTPRHGHGAIAIDGNIHILGGAKVVGGRKRTDLQEIFVPERTGS
ncbi:MAG: kelch repeat-containing protein [Pseudomonadota bacterium]